VNTRYGALLSLALAVPGPAPAQSQASRPAQPVVEKPARRLAAVAAGSYRITVAGFRVNHDTYDDPLNGDGWGDEVYASVVLQRFNRASGRLLETRTVTSQTHGDGNAAPERVPQGHASDAGGLTVGDVVPFGWDEHAAKPPVEKGHFPLVVWEGPLSDGGDVLILRPALWEQDGDRTAFDFWNKFIGSSAPSATWGLTGVQQSLTSTAIAPVAGLALEGETYLLWSASDLTDQSAAGNRKEFYVNPGRDRPIGLRGHKWYDRIMVLDREKIEAELRGEPTDRPPGLIPLRLKEEIGTGSTAPENGDYVLYLRVERQ
jgi:hypothetical protein